VSFGVDGGQEFIAESDVDWLAYLGSASGAHRLTTTFSSNRWCANNVQLRHRVFSQ
jgi:hypothetical protein